MKIKSPAALIVVAIGWSAYWWMNAEEHHFSEGSTALAIGLTAFWLGATAIALFRARHTDHDSPAADDLWPKKVLKQESCDTYDKCG